MRCPMRYGTHDGTFHADDVFAAAVLFECDKTTEQMSVVVRSRKPEILADCDLRFDVGAKYWVASNDFDHHQPGGAGARPNGIPYASFGLIWKHFGHKTLPPTLAEQDYVIAAVDERLVQPVDAADCGCELFMLNTPAVLPYSVSAAVGSFNPSW